MQSAQVADAQWPKRGVRMHTWQARQVARSRSCPMDEAQDSAQARTPWPRTSCIGPEPHYGLRGETKQDGGKGSSNAAAQRKACRT